MVGVVKSVWGALADGRAVHAFTLTRGALTATLVEYGATLVSLLAPDGSGRAEEITLCHRTLAALREGKPQCYYGATIGRVGNRIADGVFSVDGVDYRVPVNNGPNSLHGGDLGFDKRLWSGAEVAGDGSGSSATPAVKFSYVSPDGEMGYPGEVRVAVTFSLLDKGLRIQYEATTSKTTPVALTNHTYWNLSGNFRSPTILGHRLHAPNLAFYLPVNDVQIPVGGPAPVEGTPFDFTEWRVVGERLKACGGDAGYEGYDHCYVVPQAKGNCGSSGDGGGDGGDGGLAVVADVHDPSSGRTMRVMSDQPGCQLYTGNFIEGESPHVQHAALCLETQAFPDAVHQQPEQVLLKPGEVLQTVTEHYFGVSL
jgi:aldose 1-epimerase